MEMGLTRDKKFIDSMIESKDGTFYCKKRCVIEFPEWYIDKNLAEFGEEVFFYGVFAIIIDGKYAVATIPTLCRSNPIAIGSIERDGVKYTRLEFGANDPILAEDKVIQETLLSYDFFNNFFIRSKVPWFVSYMDLVKTMDNLVKYANSNVGINPVANEIVVSYITRAKTNPDLYYRQTPMKGEYGFVDLMNLFHSVRSTIGKISGSYFQEGLTSALTSDPKAPTNLELHLKG